MENIDLTKDELAFIFFVAFSFSEKNLGFFTQEK